MDSALDKLLQQRTLWRCGEAQRAERQTPAEHVIATGYPALDAVLPDGGWPRDALLEVLTGHVGVGELRLLMPALATLMAEREGYLVWVGAPYQPYAPALAQWGIDVSRVLVITADTPRDVLWATHEALVSGSAVAVLGWLQSLDIRTSRRLKLAAAKGHSLAVLFRSPAARREASAATIRLALAAGSTGTAIDLFKVSGGRPCRLPVYEQATPFWPPLTPSGTTDTVNG